MEKRGETRPEESRACAKALRQDVAGLAKAVSMRPSVPVENKETVSKWDGLIFRWVFDGDGVAQNILWVSRTKDTPRQWGSLWPNLLWPIWGPQALWGLLPRVPA